jgi:hypothetical protein
VCCDGFLATAVPPGAIVGGGSDDALSATLACGFAVIDGTPLFIAGSSSALLEKSME